MANWKDQLQEQLARQNALQAEQARKENAERERQRQEEEQQEKAARQREYDAKLADHQRRFFCSVCHKPSSGPGQKEYRLSYHVDTEAAGGSTGYSKYYETDWNIPTGLYHCRICGILFCEDHLMDWICQGCWQKHGTSAPNVASGCEQKRIREEHERDRKAAEKAYHRRWGWHL